MAYALATRAPVAIAMRRQRDGRAAFDVYSSRGRQTRSSSATDASENSAASESVSSGPT